MFGLLRNPGLGRGFLSTRLGQGYSSSGRAFGYYPAGTNRSQVLRALATSEKKAWEQQVPFRGRSGPRLDSLSERQPYHRHIQSPSGFVVWVSIFGSTVGGIVRGEQRHIQDTTSSHERELTTASAKLQLFLLNLAGKHVVVS